MLVLAKISTSTFVVLTLALRGPESTLVFRLADPQAESASNDQHVYMCMYKDHALEKSYL